MSFGMWVWVGVAAAALLYLFTRAVVRIWFAEKERHLSRVLKKMEKGEH